MTDDQRKMLTEKLLKDYWHETATAHPVNTHVCRCGFSTLYIREYGEHLMEFNRTFTTWDDLGACKDALVREGLWGDFECFAFDKFHHTIFEIPTSFSCWLFRPTDENGEPHFCRLVAEFMEERRGGND